MKNLIIILFTLFIFSACSNEETNKKAIRVLESNGYTNIKLTGYNSACCSDNEYSTGFEADSPIGKKVTGCVCTAYNKGATIRFE